jgi:hypothetical protein
MPFADRLAKFPEAWLLPLVPLVIRLMYFSSILILNLTNVHTYAIVGKSITYIFRRLCFYIMLLNIRGWILYILLNKIEDQFAATVNDTSISNCWYMNDGWFQHNSEQETHSCRPFDFSDHIVLYYAQILPIAMFEMLNGITDDLFWHSRSSSQQAEQHHHETKRARPFISQSSQWHVQLILVVSYLYLLLITSIGAYKTSAYFHTPIEVMIGFIISMIISVPLCYIQCSIGQHASITYIRTMLFP